MFNMGLFRLDSTATQTGLCVAGSLLFGVIVGLASNSRQSAGRLASSMIGWAYFCAWVISFFPQVLLNQRRQSVAGLSRDMVALATFGFVCYLSYNAALYDPASAAAKEYAARFGRSSAVTPPDVAFSAFGVGMNLIIIMQMIAFDPHGWWGLSLLWACTLGVLVAAAAGCAVAAAAGSLSWLDYVTALSWVKLAATLVKYAPQVVLNFRRRGTGGFHVLGVTLDLSGSVLSLAQLGLDCALAGSFSLVVGDPAKFGLGLLTMVYDVALIVQHAWFGPGARAADASVSASPAAGGSRGEEEQEEEGEALLGGKATHPLLPREQLPGAAGC